MKTLRLDWTQVLVDATAAFWVVPAAWAISTWLGAAIPLLALFVGFAIPALLRRRSLTAAAIGGVAAIVIAAMGLPPNVNVSAAALTLLPTAYIIALPREVMHWSLRAEFRRGMIIWLLIGIVRSILGSPADAPLAVMAFIFVSLGLVGLPLLHSRSALGAGPHAFHRARPGLNLSLLVLAASAGIALLIVGLRVLLSGPRLASLVQLLFTLLTPLAYLIVVPVANFVSHVYLHARKPPNLPPPTKVLITGNNQSLGHNTEILAVVFGIITLLAIATAAVLVARLRREALPLGNRPTSADDVIYEALTGSARRRLDLGAGARRIVRAAVWRHLRHTQRGQPPPTLTARQLAKQEGWDQEALERYEHARYQMNRHFDESMAQRFLHIFRHGRK